QYTPVASIATCVHPALSNHSASANNPCVVVGKRRTSRSTLRLLIRRRQATTSTLCTSRPAHRLCNVFIATSLGRGRRQALAHRILPTVFQDLRSQLGQPHPFGQREQLVWNFETERLRRFQIDREVEFGWLLDGKIGRPLALENPANVDTGLAVGVGYAGSVT